MRSIHRRLVISLLASLVLMLVALEFSLYFYVDRTLTANFDQSLTSRIENSVRFYQRMVARYGLALPPGGPGGRRSRSGFIPLFQLWTADGRPLMRGDHLEGEDLPFWDLPLDQPLMADVRLPGDISGRAYAVRFRVEAEGDDGRGRGERDGRGRGEREGREDGAEGRDRAPRDVPGAEREGRGRGERDDSTRDGRREQGWRPRRGEPEEPGVPPQPDGEGALGPEPDPRLPPDRIGPPPVPGPRPDLPPEGDEAPGPRPRMRPEEDSLRAVLAEQGAVELVLMVARSREDLDDTLNTIVLGLLLFGLLVPLATALCIHWSVRSGLAPLRRLTRETAAISPSMLMHRYALAALPDELRPLAERLNALLGNLQAAFRRERRFSADVAHELRTPIAELRSLAEVGLDWEPADGSPLEFFRDADAIARRMQNLVTTLLALQRSQSGMRLPALRRTDLVELVRQSWKQHSAFAAGRALTARLELGEQALTTTDPTLMGALLGNLLGNAAAYADSGGTVEVVVGEDQVTISNTCTSLGVEDVEHLCEPFWRKDPSRTDGSHCGLGLALVSAHARLLGCPFELRLHDGRLEARLRFVPSVAEEPDDAVPA